MHNKISIEIDSQWIEDSYREWGEVLEGRFAHRCPFNEHIPIDETVEEFDNCKCYQGEK